MKRNTPLPQDIQEIINQFNPGISTYGDLAFANMTLNPNVSDLYEVDYKPMISKLIQSGFNIAILKKVK